MLGILHRTNLTHVGISGLVVCPTRSNSNSNSGYITWCNCRKASLKFKGRHKH